MQVRMHRHMKLTVVISDSIAYLSAAFYRPQIRTIGIACLAHTKAGSVPCNSSNGGSGGVDGIRVPLGSSQKVDRHGL